MTFKDKYGHTALEHTSVLAERTRALAEEQRIHDASLTRAGRCVGVYHPASGRVEYPAGKQAF